MAAMAEEKSPLLGRLDVNSFASHAAFVGRRCRLSAVRAGRPELRVFDSDPDLAAAPQDLLLFIHGSCGSLEQFRAQLAHFSAGYHVVSYDALGCGASPKPDDAPAYAKAQLLADGLAVLDEHVKRRSKKGYGGGNGQRPLHMPIVVARVPRCHAGCHYYIRCCRFRCHCCSPRCHGHPYLLCHCRCTGHCL